jgi:CspA family cold shock protein
MRRAVGNSRAVKAFCCHSLVHFSQGVILPAIVRKEEKSMNEGIVKWYNKNKNYGFIEFDEQEDIFFHSSNIVDHGYFGLKKTDRVRFEIKDTRYGRQAVNIKVIS